MTRKTRKKKKMKEEQRMKRARKKEIFQKKKLLRTNRNGIENCCHQAVTSANRKKRKFLTYCESLFKSGQERSRSKSIACQNVTEIAKLS